MDDLRVSTGQMRMKSIARSMVESGWERLPCSPAMDIREDGKTYEILFALPEGVAQESVRVTAAGSVLTLAMKDTESGQAYLRRVRLPCSVDRVDRVQSVISNSVLRVRIQQPSG
jgi:HSP20 family molecular chaperone IbpA